MEHFLGNVKKLFVKARAVETKYFKRLSELGEVIEELAYTTLDHGDEGSEEASEDVKILALIAKCHDGHQSLLLTEEEKLQESVERWREDFLNKFRKKERKRNRNRILELNHFIDTMRQEEEEDLDVLPSNEFNIGEDILLID